MSMRGFPPGPQPVEVEGQMVLYGDGMTKQSFKDQTDINKILNKAQRMGSLSHLVRHGAVYGDFSDVDDLLTAQKRLARGAEIFQELPSEVRREFDGDMLKFFEFVNDPQNADKLQDVLPQLAEPGRQLPDVRRSGDSQQNPARADAEPVIEPVAASEPTPSGDSPASSSTT